MQQTTSNPTHAAAHPIIATLFPVTRSSPSVGHRMECQLSPLNFPSRAPGILGRPGDPVYRDVLNKKSHSKESSERASTSLAISFSCSASRLAPGTSRIGSERAIQMGTEELGGSLTFALYWNR